MSLANVLDLGGEFELDNIILGGGIISLNKPTDVDEKEKREREVSFGKYFTSFFPLVFTC